MMCTLFPPAAYPPRLSLPPPPRSSSSSSSSSWCSPVSSSPLPVSPLLFLLFSYFPFCSVSPSPLFSVSQFFFS
ncbi:hypothetical protein E2C01_015099 [Portunus trituberculatus]|uniref:Uncharacterized protein n=1 Tax=Portunus trituberculatus TaxID=210409 RepID=A0A5B7DLX2_PORTR|nr:hypothetical protein [Portunus trituberculatus]